LAGRLHKVLLEEFQMIKLHTLAAAVLLPLSFASAQQVLILNDGTQLQGRLVSSTANTVVFREDGGDLRRFNINELQTLTFGGSGASNRPFGNDGAFANGQPGYQQPVYNRNGGPPAPVYNNGQPGYQQPPYNAIRDDSNRPNNGGNQPYTRRTQDNYTAWTTLPSGTQIAVRTNEPINSRNAGNGRTYMASIAQDILDSNGNILVPQGSDAQLVVRSFGDNSVGLDLQTISVNGTLYQVNSADIREEGSGKDGIGKNKRTGEYVGGGALLGTLLGAIAGGGRGALIGAAAGGAAGAGAEVLTKGDSVRVPAETVLTFRLDTPLQLSQPR
jgi:hypothetical protein